MSLPMEKLDHYLVAYVWATKTGLMGAQNTTLVGHLGQEKRETWKEDLRTSRHKYTLTH